MSISAPKQPRLSYVWAMPHKNTFNIKPINSLIKRYLDETPADAVWVDPFANNSCFLSRMKFSNDLNESFNTTHHMDALEFLKTLPTASVDGVLFDPPYSIHQKNEVYEGVGGPVKQATAYYSEIDRICKPKATVISLGWTASGVPATLSRDENLQKMAGKRKRQTEFEKVEVLVVPHGGGHNATLIVVDKRE